MNLFIGSLIKTKMKENGQNKTWAFIYEFRITPKIPLLNQLLYDSFISFFDF